MVILSDLDLDLIAIGIEYTSSLAKDRPAATERALRDDKTRPGIHEITRFGSRYAEIDRALIPILKHEIQPGPAFVFLALIYGCLLTPVRFVIFSQLLLIVFTRNAGNWSCACLNECHLPTIPEVPR